MTSLGPGFEPTALDIILARGRTAYNHEGNRRFRSILEQNLEKYQHATSKQRKSQVVVSILEEVQSKSRFVRSGADGKWYQVPEHVAKEKIGQGFRDLLHTRYRSSTKSKVQLRRERRRRQRSNKTQETDITCGNIIDTSGGEKWHRSSSSCETLEPLPLDHQPANSEEAAFIYDCPFSFATREDNHTPVGGADITELQKDQKGIQSEEDLKPPPDDLRTYDEDSEGRNGVALVTPTRSAVPSPHGRAHHEADHAHESHLDSNLSPANLPEDSATEFGRSHYHTPPPYYPSLDYPSPVYYAHSPRYPPPRHQPDFYQSSYYPLPDYPPTPPPSRPGWSYSYHPYATPPRGYNSHHRRWWAANREPREDYHQPPLDHDHHRHHDMHGWREREPRRTRSDDSSWWRHWSSQPSW